jgi:hypothetical protein
MRSRRPVVVVHVLLWNARDGVPPELTARVLAEFRALTGRIPSIRQLWVGEAYQGRLAGQPARQYAYAAVLVFDDRQGLQEFYRHPAHAEFVPLWQRHRRLEDALVVDYEG